jgi:uncharacterized glyoxalase superfamily protein PhnB
MAEISLGYIIHYVEDVKSTLDFYSKAFGFEIRFISPDGTYGELSTGATTLAFASNLLAASNFETAFTKTRLDSPPPGIEIGLVTTDVNGFMEEAIKCGATLVASPKTKPWGQVVGYLRDLDGLLIEICSPMEA